VTFLLLVIISGAVLVSTLEALGILLQAAALEKVTLPLAVSVGPVFALGSGQTSLAAMPP